MVIKVGINSFGRIGRVIFRTCTEHSDIEVSAINDPVIDLEYMCYLIKFDSTHGKFSGTVSHEADEIKVNGQSIKVFHHKAPADIPWHEAGVQYVVEASGMFTSVEKASGHLTSEGVRRVVVTAPSADAPMLILGVNENSIKPDMKVISCASSTLYCLAPIIKVLEDAYGVGDGFVTSIHAMTPSLKPLDGLCVRGKHWRDHRSIHQNIIPAATGACRALGKILPACRDRLAGLAFRVPVVNGSVLDITLRLNKNTSIAEISKTIEDSNNSLLRNIIQVSKEKAVSSDFLGDTHSCVLDTDSSLQIKPNFFKLICWYENEYSYSCRVIDTVLFLETQFQAQILTPTRLMYMRPVPSNLQNIENSQGDVRRPYVSFCVPGLLNNRPNIKPSLQSLEMKATTAQYSIHHQSIGPPSIRGNKESIKSYIDRLTKCKCNEKQNIDDNIRIDSKDDNEHKVENCFKKIEKEVSEMLNIAEDLLNKSSSKKLLVAKKSKKICIKESKNRDIMRKNIIAKISDTLEKIREVKIDTLNTDITGAHKKLDVDDYLDKVSLPTDADSLSNSQLKLRKSNSQTKTVNSNISLNTLMYKKYPDSRDVANFPLTNDNTFYISNDLKSEYHTNVHDEDDTSTVATIVSEKLENTLKFLNNTTQGKSKVTNHFSKKCNERSDSIKRNGRNEIKCNTSENKDKTETVVSISNLNMDRKAESDSKEDVKQECIELKETVGLNNIHEARNNNNDIKNVDGKATEKFMNSPGCSSSTIGNVSEKSFSGIISSYATVSKNNSSYRTQDIYDKLDSESMSDSGSSYRIREKTSQVINITDLTYSLEDLPRLDKICRVIEISDELSDKMFSPLADDNYDNTTNRKWSFQDLCERIKYDEFFNGLFEKSAS
ncbi:uncharacterized protein LOC133526729 [Cydia pomonella]|uniref:uncharacterized protein LOC133526729 n=1 Tax=Cydia pomonella TaxID=82600 RepID=UPI002ADD8E4D|nr:uncharacterized protein LOC133526729 [Cydia pomonella]